jgi:prepilin-type N-terminal cleavage/methylation domain-containing protein
MNIHAANYTPQKNILKKGVTLVELLIVVGIIALISLAIIPSYVDFAQKKDFQNKVENLAAEIQNVRNKSLAGVVYTSGGTSTEVNWAFRPSQNCDLRQYELGYVLPNTTTFYPVTTEDLPENVTFEKSGGQCDVIIFERLKGTPILDTTINETSQEVSLKYHNVTKTITVNSAGRISYN